MSLVTRGIASSNASKDAPLREPPRSVVVESSTCRLHAEHGGKGAGRLGGAHLTVAGALALDVLVVRQELDAALEEAISQPRSSWGTETPSVTVRERSKLAEEVSALLSLSSLFSVRARSEVRSAFAGKRRGDRRGGAMAAAFCLSPSIATAPVALTDLTDLRWALRPVLVLEESTACGFGPGGNGHAKGEVEEVSRKSRGGARRPRGRLETSCFCCSPPSASGGRTAKPREGASGARSRSRGGGDHERDAPRRRRSWQPLLRAIRCVCGYGSVNRARGQNPSCPRSFPCFPLAAND